LTTWLFSFIQRKGAIDDYLASLDEKRARCEEEVISAYRPSNLLPLSNPTSSHKPVVDANTPIAKEGYLFKRTHPKSPLIAPSWVRRWCFIENGRFGYKAVLSKQRVCCSCTGQCSNLDRVRSRVRRHLVSFFVKSKSMIVRNDVTVSKLSLANGKYPVSYRLLLLFLFHRHRIRSLNVQIIFITSGNGRRTRFLAASI
jgi:hypothetical protein